MMTNPDPASAVASAAIAAAAAGPLSKLVLGNQRQVLGNLRQVLGNQGQVQHLILVGITKTKTTRLDLFLLMPRPQVGGCPTGWTSSTTSSLLRTIYCYRFQSFSSRFTILSFDFIDCVLKRLLYQNLGRGGFFPRGKVQLSEAEKHHVGV